MSGQLWLMDRGGGNLRLVDHWGANPSWVISDVGRLTAFITARTARSLGYSGGDITGTTWCRYRHRGLPDWGGVSTQPEWTDDGTLRLSFESFESLFRKRRVPRTYGQQSAPAGALAQRAFTDCQADDYFFIRSFAADEDGDPIKWDWRGGDMKDDVFRGLVAASNQEWRVTADRDAEWRVRIGQDKTAFVRLYHPYEIVSYRYVTDLWTVVNDIEGVAADQRYERSAHVVLDHNDSVKTLGRYQETRRFPGVVNKATLRPKVRRDLHRTAWPAEVMELTTVNVGASWSRYHVGDSIKVQIPSANVIRQVRIGARSVDVDSGTERLGVEVEFERDGW